MNTTTISNGQATASEARELLRKAATLLEDLARPVVPCTVDEEQGQTLAAKIREYLS